MGEKDEFKWSTTKYMHGLLNAHGHKKLINETRGC